jgi:hypothetical protein
VRVQSHPIILGIVVAVVLTGCGSGEEPTPPAGTAPPPTLAPVDATPPPTAATGVAPGVADPLLILAGCIPEEGQAPLTVRCDVTPDGGQSPFTYRWTFQDGSPDSSEPVITHTFKEPGLQQIDVYVKDASGDEDRDYVIITVLEPGGAPTGEEAPAEKGAPQG